MIRRRTRHGRATETYVERKILEPELLFLQNRGTLLVK